MSPSGFPPKHVAPPFRLPDLVMLDVEFTGNFWTFSFAQIGLFVLSVLTLGIAIPFWIYWTNKYFFTRLKVGDRHFQFQGTFVGYFFKSLLLLLLTVVTLGLLSPYYAYWNKKYFAAHIQIPKA